MSKFKKGDTIVGTTGVQYIVVAPEVDGDGDIIGIHDDVYAIVAEECCTLAPKKVKYLKSVPEIMEQFPEAYFDIYGNIWLGAMNAIYSSSLWKCGKPVPKSNQWSEELIKEVEEE